MHLLHDIRPSKTVYFFFSLLFICTNGTISSASNRLLLDNSNSGKTINQFIEYYQETDKPLSIEEILSSDYTDKFHPFDSEATPTNDSFLNSVWIRLKAENRSSETVRWYLEIESYYINDITIFQFRDNKPIPVSISTIQSILNKKLSLNTLVASLSSSPGNETIYMRIKFPVNYEFSYYYWTKDHFIQKKRPESVFTGVFIGILFFMLLFNILLLLLIRDKNYFLLSIYILIMCFISLVRNNYLIKYISGNTISMSEFYPLAIATASLIFTIFARFYLQSKRFTPLIDKMIIGLIVLLSLDIPLTMFIPYKYLMLIMMIKTPFYIAISFVLLIASSIIAYSKGHKRALAFLTAFLILVITGFIPLFNAFYKLSLSIIVIEYIRKFGILFFVVMMTLEQTFNTKKYLNELSILNTNLEGQVAIRTEEIETARLDLTEKNNRIMDSITYAKRIQKSILPEQSLLNSFFDDCFIFWNPRDLVGGDFYWFKKSKKSLLLAVVDCTGHGVPGALMTMTCNSILNHIFHEHWNGNPGQFLKELHFELQTTLNQDKKGSYADDGLDITLYCINPGKKHVVFSGAKQNAWYAQDGVIKMIKGDKYSVGYRRSLADFEFKNHVINYNKGDVFYLCSDGFVDQNGGERNFSFGKKQFRALLSNIFHLPLSTQHKELLSKLKQYMAENEQRDDITVIGFQV